MTVASKAPLQDSPYQKQGLQPDEIRLLTLEVSGNSLQLHTAPHRITNITEYDAISYVWGTAPASVRVSCNEKDLMITPTAYEMLQYLLQYRPNINRPLWIDAICINQEDVEEKVIQIPLMHQIYSKASHVIVWAGALIPQTQSFMADFPRVMEIAREWTSMRAANVDPGFPNWPAADSQFWPGLFHLLNNEWFQRLWTFQEIILARHSILLCGSAWINLDDLIEFTVNGFFSAGEYIPFNETTSRGTPGSPKKSDLAWEECLTIQRYRESFQETDCITAVNIPMLTNTLRSRQVKEPVDRIWAIAGLFEADFQRKLKLMIDYSDAGREQFWKTYVRFTKMFIDDTRSLGILCIPPAIGKRDERIPSWCPNLAGKQACTLTIVDYWNYPLSHSGQPCRENLFAESDDEAECLARITAIQRHPRRYISTHEDRFLRVCGFVVDTITEVIEDERLLGAMDYIYNSEWSTMSLTNPMHVANLEWHARSLSLACRTIYGRDDLDEIPQEFLMAFFADCRVSKEAQMAYRDALAMVTSCDPTDVMNLEISHRKRVYECIGKFKGRAGYSFFSTEGRRFGIATPGCKPGAKVCVFYGGHPLHILRSKAGNEDVKFCGVSFIPHLMEPYQSDHARLSPDEIFIVS